MDPGWFRKRKSCSGKCRLPGILPLTLKCKRSEGSICTVPPNFVFYEWPDSHLHVLYRIRHLPNMSFRKRNAVISASPAAQANAQSRTETQLAPGLRPSPLDGRLTTSTGTSSLDAILAGHAGLALGSSLLIEEHGTTDFSGALLRYYAAEGLVQGHHVHVFGFSEAWKHELPSLSARQDSTSSSKTPSQSDEKMKIAWRYETLGNRSAPSNTGKGRYQDPTTLPLPLYCYFPSRQLVSDW